MQASSPTLHLVYGGTFDPPHLGHLAIARAARDALEVPVWLMPAADPPHRAVPGASAVQRAEMLSLAISGESGLFVDLRELRRAVRQPEARSYTIDTLRELRAELGPDAPLALLMGADSFLGLPGWKAWRELFAYAHIVVADRPGLGLDEGLPPELAEISALRWRTRAADLQEVAAGLLLRLHQPLHPASATSVRECIAAGQDWQALVPPGVAAFIASHCLYGMDGADDRPTL